MLTRMGSLGLLDYRCFNQSVIYFCSSHVVQGLSYFHLSTFDQNQLEYHIPFWEKSWRQMPGASIFALIIQVTQGPIEHKMGSQQASILRQGGTFELVSPHLLNLPLLLAATLLQKTGLLPSFQRCYLHCSKVLLASVSL